MIALALYEIILQPQLLALGDRSPVATPNDWLVSGGSWAECASIPVDRNPAWR